MKPSHWNVLICALGCALLVSCGAPGVPIPPALELAKPVIDLRAARKGNRVDLAWTVPAKTTDRQAVRHPGVTLVCRSLREPVTDCKNPAAEVPPDRFPLLASNSAGKNAPTQKVLATFTDILPEELQKQDPSAQLVYAVSVRNENGRSAGLSNQVQVPSAPTLPPPDRFRAEVQRDGVLLAWDCPPAATAPDAVAHRMRIYRGEPGKQTASKVSDANLVSCPQTQPAAEAPQFLDRW
jgi:hypothetical protein